MKKTFIWAIITKKKPKNITLHFSYFFQPTKKSCSDKSERERVEIESQNNFVSTKRFFSFLQQACTRVHHCVRHDCCWCMQTGKSREEVKTGK